MINEYHLKNTKKKERGAVNGYVLVSIYRSRLIPNEHKCRTLYYRQNKQSTGLRIYFTVGGSSGRELLSGSNVLPLDVPSPAEPSCPVPPPTGDFSFRTGQSAIRWSSLLQLWHRFGWGPIVHFAAM